MIDKQDKLESLHKYLNRRYTKENFVLADGYIFSGFVKKIHFDLFINNEKIGLKYPKPNLSKSKINQLSTIILELDSRFVYREYNTTSKSRYSIWEINVVEFSENEIENFLIDIQKIYT